MTLVFAPEGITHRRRALFVQHGLLVVFFGLIGGIGFAFAIFWVTWNFGRCCRVLNG